MKLALMPCKFNSFLEKTKELHKDYHLNMAKLESKHLKLLLGGTLKTIGILPINGNPATTFRVCMLLFYLFVLGVNGHSAGNDTSTDVNNTRTDIVVKDSNKLVVNSNNSVTCICGGSDGVPCEKSVTSADCPNGRVISRHDCPCCFVCAKQLTESCNDKDSLCDSDYGLMCGADQKCQAKSSCSDDTGCSNQEMCVGGACADPCKVLPDVCREMDLKNGTCVVRNHRPICSCSLGRSVNSRKECVLTQDEATHCEKDGLKHKIGSKFYKESCKKLCECEASGSLNCKMIDDPDCKTGTVALSKLGGEMTHACKLLIGHGHDFDGCCVPEKCANISVTKDDLELLGNSSEDSEAEEGSKGGRGFKISDSANKLSQLESNNGKVIGVKSGKTILHDDKSESNEEESTSSSDEKSLSVVGFDSVGNSSTHSTASPMEVMILQRTDHSAVIDLPTSSNQAILSIALTGELNKDPSSNEVWKEHKIPPGLPQITLSDLSPSTSYTLKYSVNGKDSSAVQFITDEIGSSTQTPKNSLDATSSTTATLGSRGGGVGTATGRSMNIDEVTPKDASEISDSTESSSTSTSQEAIKPTSASGSAESFSGSNETMNLAKEEKESLAVQGCTYNGTFYKVGHIILNGCDEKCTCMEGGEVKCAERCVIPLFKKGSFAHDKMCFEEPSGTDECCVIIACARGKPADEAKELIPIHPEPCDSVKCGKNARCLGPSGMLGDDENQTNQTLCLCNESFVGDPYDEVHGCQESVTPSAPSIEGSSPSSVVTPTDVSTTTSKADGCIFNNQTFEFGAEHFDGCNYKCRCENSGEFTCLPRCNYRRDDENEVPKGCDIQKDPSDSCCEMLVCHGKPLESGTRKDESTTLVDGCGYKNKTYAREEKFYDGCDSQCMCFSNGDVTCQPRCPPAGPQSVENNCVSLEDPADKCCKVTICGNQTLYDEVMKAEAAKLSTSTTTTTSTTAAPSTTESSSVPPVIGIQRSATSSEEMEGEASPEKSSSSSELPPTGPPSEPWQHNHKESQEPELDIKISMVVPLNSSAMMITVSIPENELTTLLSETMIIRYSHDLTTWRNQEFAIKDLLKEGTEELHATISGLAAGQQYYFKAVIKGSESNAASGLTKFHSSDSGESSSVEGHSDSLEHMIHNSASDEDKTDLSSSMEGGVPCKHKDKMYEPGQEFYDGCDAYCLCDGRGNVTCVEIDCPRDGRELIDESCVRWEPDLRNFKKEAPFCCPDMVCVQHSHCELEDGFILQNFEEIHHKFTGCDKTCQCLFGNITCHAGNNCPHISDRPPAALVCPPGGIPKQVRMAEDECCHQWACVNATAEHYPPPPSPFGLPQHHSAQHPDASVSNIIIQPLNESTLQIDFTVSPILVGLHGHVEVLYTMDFGRKPNPAQWESKVFQQAEDLIDNTHLQLFLTSLQPDTDYHMQIKVVVMAQFQPTSDILLVRTPARAIPTTTLPPEILVDPEIQLASASSRSVKLHWKKFDDYDTLIDGVQIAFKESEDKVYQTTPLIHRSVAEYELTNLKPNKDYEVNLLFIPFHTDQKTILKSEKPIFIKTDREEDEYGFDLALNAGKVSYNSVELKVTGAPVPVDKYVSLYQVFYSSDSEKEQKSYFKVPNTETTKKATLTELRPGTKYTIWLEAFLTNGKKKRSNVIDVTTKAGELPSPEKSEQETLESKTEPPQAASYYGALVALAIVAAMSILGIIALLMILIKKQNQAKAPINDRKSESSYDNPSFKSYDVESNGHIKPGEL